MSATRATTSATVSGSRRAYGGPAGEGSPRLQSQRRLPSQQTCRRRDLRQQLLLRVGSELLGAESSWVRREKDFDPDTGDARGIPRPPANLLKCLVHTQLRVVALNTTFLLV